MYSENMKEKYMTGRVKEVFFSQSCRLASHNFITDWLLNKQFLRILSEWTPSNGYFLILYKMLEKHLWNSFSLYLVVEILQLVNKIAVSPICSIKEWFWKTSQNSQINTRSSHPEVFCQKKECSETFCKIQRKTSFPEFLFH